MFVVVAVVADAVVLFLVLLLYLLSRFRSKTDLDNYVPKALFQLLGRRSAHKLQCFLTRCSQTNALDNYVLNNYLAKNQWLF